MKFKSGLIARLETQIKVRLDVVLGDVKELHLVANFSSFLTSAESEASSSLVAAWWGRSGTHVHCGGAVWGYSYHKSLRDTAPPMCDLVVFVGDVLINWF